jgi:hypothetical protein
MQWSDNLFAMLVPFSPCARIIAPRQPITNALPELMPQHWLDGTLHQFIDDSAESNDERCQEGGYRNFKKLTGTVENFSQRAARPMSDCDFG